MFFSQPLLSGTLLGLDATGKGYDTPPDDIPAFLAQVYIYIERDPASCSCYPTLAAFSVKPRQSALLLSIVTGIVIVFHLGRSFLENCVVKTLPSPYIIIFHMVVCLSRSESGSGRKNKGRNRQTDASKKLEQLPVKPSYKSTINFLARQFSCLYVQLRYGFIRPG